MPKLDPEIKDLLKSIYYSSTGSAGSFSSSLPLYRVAKKQNDKVTHAQVKLFLQSNKSYVTHKRALRKFPRKRMLVFFPGEIFAADLIFFSGKSSPSNLHKTSAINVIDCFTKLAFSRALHSKKSSEVLENFQSILSEAKVIPKYLFVDDGSG